MRGSREGGQGVRTLLKKHKNIGFLNKTDPDPLKIIKQPSPIQRWRADDGPLVVVFGSCLTSSTKKIYFHKTGQLNLIKTMFKSFRVSYGLPPVWNRVSNGSHAIGATKQFINAYYKLAGKNSK